MMRQTEPYRDITHFPHHVSDRHPRMPMVDRAAQFSPFAALTGYDEAVLEAARLTETRAELSEDRMSLFSRRLALVRQHIRERPEITVTFFCPDGKKTGGAYRTVTGQVRKLDEYEKTVLMTDGTVIAIENIYGIEGTIFDGEDET